jgi:hypothetical protein
MIDWWSVFYGTLLGFIIGRWLRFSKLPIWQGTLYDTLFKQQEQDMEDAKKKKV